MFKRFLLPGLAALFLLGFAGVWIWIGIELLLADGDPPLTFDGAQVEVAGFLASAVGAGTASVLGIEIQKAGSTERALAGRVSKAFSESLLLAIGVLVYALVGAFVLGVWFFNSDLAPDLIGAFALGVLGWFAGAFTAVFRAET